MVRGQVDNKGERKQSGRGAGGDSDVLHTRPRKDFRKDRGMPGRVCWWLRMVHQLWHPGDLVTLTTVVWVGWDQKSNGALV